MRYAFIRKNRSIYSVSTLCKVLSVSSSGYYDWVDRPMSNTAKKNRQLTTKIRCFHKASNDIYGAPRIQRDLVDDGEQVSRQRVGRLMKQADIQSKVVKKFIVTTDSKSTTKPAPDRLRRSFATPEPNQAWVTDTTFIRTRKGWLFLATVLDLYSRKVVGWSMSDRNNTKLVIDALTMAFWRRKVRTKIIVHSDRGSTYASLSYRALIAENSGLCSMSRKGDCYDNAVAESFFGSLKSELVDHEDYRTKEQARQSVFKYIE
ncbi:hypothetical protein NBRC116583_02020 [Arenicella sp. 4NH20-0111]|uniref:IS3 family transposase n=1 Tax=Arenicella sp. 4NH20-0111 TaxID=3127648 RepID=UPI003103629D